MSGDDTTKVYRKVATVGAAFFGGSFALYSLTSSISQSNTLHKKKKFGRSCGTCKGIGYYACKLCKGNGTITWSPLYDPVVINPCLCPTCDGFKCWRGSWVMQDITDSYENVFVGSNTALTAWDMVRSYRKAHQE